MKRSKIGQPSAAADAKSSAFASTQNVSEIDRRGAERREYPVHEQIAPYQDAIPASSDFEQVLCHDLSTSGISFFRARPMNAGDKLVVSLSQNLPTIFMAATVMHCRPTIVNGEDLYQVGCRFDQQMDGTRPS